MSELRKIVENIESVISESHYPQDFLQAYDQMECLASHSGRETFLVRRKSDGMQAVAKCFDRQIFPVHPDSELLNSLSGAGLPEHYETFRDEKTVCIVREYIDGMPLNLYVKKKTPDRQEILSIADQLCGILDRLHSHTPPIIHRDIKPENIIIGPDGKVTLIDFDISRVYQAGAGSDTIIFGTKGYAPPEQYGFGQTDQKADIYAFGVLLRWMVTGSIRNNPNVQIDPVFQHTIDRCTAFSPDDRFPDIRAVRASLSRPSERKPLLSGKALLCMVLCGLLLVSLGFVIGRYSGLFRAEGPEAMPVSFIEPMIEKAVRARLGVGPDKVLYPEDLAGVDRLYIFGTEVYAEADPFFAQRIDDHTRGTVHTLDDLLMMPMLEELRIVFQGYVDISALSQMKNLRAVMLKHLRLDNADPLAEIPMLREAELFDTGITDVTVLSQCHWLESLDVGYDPIPSMDRVGSHPYLRDLCLRGLHLETLDGIENMPNLQVLTLAKAEIGDLSALTRLPKLNLVRGTAELKDAVEAVLAGTDVEWVETDD